MCSRLLQVIITVLVFGPMCVSGPYHLARCHRAPFGLWSCFGRASSGSGFERVEHCDVGGRRCCGRGCVYRAELTEKGEKKVGVVRPDRAVGAIVRGRRHTSGGSLCRVL